MEIERRLNLPQLLEKKSFFLFGPRSTGKSTLIRQQLPHVNLYIDLLDGSTYLRLSNDPSLLEQMTLQSLVSPQSIGKKDTLERIVVIDEVQKLPILLDQVHRLIENQRIKFLLTGSSARKLRSGSSNLLAGRAWEAHLFPLVYPEMKSFKLEHNLRFGSLPQVYLSQYPEEELSAYVQTYLQQEIQMEGFVRKLPQFARFLKVAAISNAHLLNFSSVASDCGVPASTVREYYSILEDTLVGFFVHPWQESQKRKAIQTAKFYLFDLGVTHTLAGTQVLDRNSDLFGRSFEHWMALEIRAYLSYLRIKKNLFFWRTVNGQEVDFLIDDQVAIEVKSSKKISERDLKNLRALKEENIVEKLFCVSLDPLDRIVDGIQCLHWQRFIAALWNDSIL